MIRSVTQNHTQVLVSFHTWKPERIDAFAVQRTGAGQYRIYSSLTTITTTKTKTGPAGGQVAIRMKGTPGHGEYEHVPWPNLIEEGDWWSFDVIKNGRMIGGLCGRIDEISLNATVSGQGAAMVEVTVIGRGVGFALDDTAVYFNPYDDTADNAVGEDMEQIIGSAAGAPHEVITNLIRGFMGGNPEIDPLGGHTYAPPTLLEGRDRQMRQQFAAASGANGVSWLDFVDLSTTSNGGYVQEDLRGKAVTPTIFGTQEATDLWSFLNSWYNPTLNELYFDVAPTPGLPKKGNLVFREKPFVNAADGHDSPWFSLRTWTVDAAKLTAANLSRGRHRLNHFHLLGDMVPGLSEDSYAIYQPAMDIESIRRHGLRRLQENTRYYAEFGTDGAAGEFINDGWLGLVISWNVLNHEYWAGRLDIGEMLPQIRVGQKLAVINGPIANYRAFPDDGSFRRLRMESDAADATLTFYVEAVQQTYVEGANPQARTSVQVSRGYVEGERVRAVQEAVLRYEVASEVGSANDNTRLDPTYEELSHQIDPTAWPEIYDMVPPGDLV